MIKIIGPHDKKKFLAQEKAVLIDVTSQSLTWHKAFSPFLLGPCKLYGPYGSFNVENAWQYAKVYEKHVDANKDPDDTYWDWACAGWGKTRAERYPMGKGSVPLYSFWNGEKLGYVEAKKRIYIPLYERAVRVDAVYYFIRLIDEVEELIKQGFTVGFFDFDGFDNEAEGMTFDDVLNSSRKLGHGMVLARMVERALEEDSE